MWTLLKILQWTSDFFKQKNISNARMDAEYIIAHALGIGRLDIYLKFEEEISTEARAKIKEMVVRRANREPLQYILGETQWHNCTLQLNKQVLIPRHETEQLVEYIIAEQRENLRVLDIGTGSGAIAIALAMAKPSWHITASDVSGGALQVATKNAALNKVEVKFMESDVFAKIDAKYDIIVSNPPYIPMCEYKELQTEIVDHEPQNALVATENGLYFYQKIMERAAEFLTDDGIIYFEIGETQAKAISDYAKLHGYHNIELKQDFAGLDRMLRIAK